VQVHNNGTISADVEITFYYSNGSLAGIGNFVVQPGELLTKHAFDLVTNRRTIYGLPIFLGL